MKLALLTLLIASLSVGFIGYVYKSFDFKSRDSDLKGISKKLSIVEPSLNFKARAYREFVYAK